MGNMKRHLKDQEKAFADNAGKPKGILLIGEPGTGMSLVTKEKALLVTDPLFRLDEEDEDARNL